MAAVAMGVGTAAQVVGALRQGKMNAQAAEYNATVAERNAATAEQQAAENARRSLIQTNKALGAQKAGFAASGVSGGSALDVLEETASMGELDALTIKNQGAIRASMYRGEVVQERYRAKQELLSGYINATSVAAKGAGSAVGSSGGGGAAGGAA